MYILFFLVYVYMWASWMGVLSWQTLVKMATCMVQKFKPVECCWCRSSVVLSIIICVSCCAVVVKWLSYDLSCLVISKQIVVQLLPMGVSWVPGCFK